MKTQIPAPHPREAKTIQPGQPSAALVDHSPRGLQLKRWADSLEKAPRQLALQRKVDPTTEVNGVAVNDDPALEHEADVMGQKAMRFVPGLEAPPQGTFADPPQREAKQPGRPNNTGLPDNLKAGMEQLSGLSMDQVKVHYGSEKPAQLKALAYTQGTDIHVAPGQERHLAHEAWHVVQQSRQTGRGPAARVPGPGAAPVVQRRMGLEAETRRVLKTPGDTMISQGDTKVIDHAYFTLVTDKFKGSSNLEFVMKHFDQLEGSEEEAIAALNTRIDAMKALCDHLYANTGALNAVVPQLGTGPTDSYHPRNVKYQEEGGKKQNFNSADALVAPSPLADDQKLYVHYTIGFHPSKWKKMVTATKNASRDDTASTRGKTIATQALAMAEYYNPSGLTPDELEEARGHLALMYMQMNVWADRTASLQEKQLTKLAQKDSTKVTKLAEKIKAIEKDESLDLITKDKQRQPLEKDLKRARRIARRSNARLAALKEAMDFGGGQVKNKIIALPRASLSLMFSSLTPKVQQALSHDQDEILDKLSEALESNLNLDLNEGYSLSNDAGDTATLGEFLKAGLGSGQQITQEVLFGGMNEVGVDNSSVTHPNLVPFEFRSLFKPRVTWDELRADAIKLLKWSRDPG